MAKSNKNAQPQPPRHLGIRGVDLHITQPTSITLFLDKENRRYKQKPTHFELNYNKIQA